MVWYAALADRSEHRPRRPLLARGGILRVQLLFYTIGKLYFLPFTIMMSTTIPSTDFLEAYPQEREGLQAILQQIAELPVDDQGIVLQALARYMQEGVNNSYQTEPDALVRLIRDKDLLKGSEKLMDFGAGPGQLIEELSHLFPDVQMCGIDLSPAFVGNFNRSNTLPHVKMNVGLIDRPLGNIDLGNRTSAISVLTLDRLAYPKVLIQNMARFNRAKILATLLPIVPEDDNPSRQDEENKIVYTREVNRIVPGRNGNEDREALRTLLKQEWKKPVHFAETEYVVSSSGDRQVYELGVFYTS